MFPADAGMNRNIPFASSADSYVPRRRGDEPVKNEPEDALDECSPQTRG